MTAAEQQAATELLPLTFSQKLILRTVKKIVPLSELLLDLGETSS